MKKILMIIEMDIYTNEIEKSELSKEIKDCKTEIIKLATDQLEGRTFGINIQNVKVRSISEKI